MQNYEVFDINNNKYLLNLQYGSVIEIDNRVSNIMINKEYENLSEDEYTLLKDEGYFDKIIIDNTNRFDFDNIQMTIAVTNFCNFTCDYCFEKTALNKKRASEKDKDMLIDNLEKFIRYKKPKTYHIIYFGGEPLLESKFILKLNDKMMQLSEELDFEYSNSFISNGFLLSSKFIEKLAKQNTTEFQITIDGNKQIHNSRRTTVNKDDTYTVLLENVSKLLNNNINVIIKTNIDTLNNDSVNELIEDLKLLKQNDKNNLLSFTVNRVVESVNTLPIEEYNLAESKINKMAYALKLLDVTSPIPASQAYCLVDRLTDSLIYDIFGNAYMCLEDVFQEEKSIFKIDDVLNAAQTHDYSRINELYEHNNIYNDSTVEHYSECLNCKYWGYCHGGCPKQRNLNNFKTCKEQVREKIKNHLENYLNYQDS